MTDSNFNIYSAAVSDRGLSEKRPQNEDSYVELNKFGLFAVADGVGGAQAGDVASQMAVEILGEAFTNLQLNGDAEEMMKLAIERANSAIYQMSTDLPQLATMATTVVALNIHGNIATIGHVGDSRLYRLDAKGTLYRETQDHSIVEEEVRAGRMTAMQAANHPSRNVISRALGAESTVEVDMKTIMFDSNTVFLLCSDGITRHIDDFEIRELMLSNASPADICQKMKEVCYSRGAEDNLTAVFVKAVHEITATPIDNEPLELPDDEATVATARTEDASVFSGVTEGSDEIPTRNLQMPPTMLSDPVSVSSPIDDDGDHFLMEETLNQNASDSGQATVEESLVATAANETAAHQAASTKTRRFEEADDVPENGGAIGRLLYGFVWLIVGALLGVGGYYFWLTQNAKPAEVPPLQMQSQDIALTSYEQRRRRVDANPQEMITVFAKTPPVDASDFYFLGRALLLTKRHDEAKRAFIDARNKLGEYSDSTNKSVLTMDLTAGLVSAQYKADFDKELGFANGNPAPVNQSNTNR